MTNFIVNNLINKKLSWEKVLSSRVYSVYIKEVLKTLDERGFMLDEEKNVIAKPAE